MAKTPFSIISVRVLPSESGFTRVRVEHEEGELTRFLDLSLCEAGLLANELRNKLDQLVVTPTQDELARAYELATRKSG